MGLPTRKFKLAVRTLKVVIKRKIKARNRPAAPGVAEKDDVINHAPQNQDRSPPDLKLKQPTDSDHKAASEPATQTSSSPATGHSRKKCKMIRNLLGTDDERAPQATAGPSDGWEIYQREMFGSILDVTDKALIELVVSSVPIPGFSTERKEAARAKATVTRNTEGQNNRVFIVDFGGEEPMKVCVRVPACGRVGLWTDIDAGALRDYALTMKYIKDNTGCPVPGVFGYDTTLENAIGAPYIAMSFMKGRGAAEVWQNQGPDKEQKRQTLLKSLAKAISELRVLEFNGMGGLQFPTDDTALPSIGPVYFANFGNTTRDAEFFKCQEEFVGDGPFDNSVSSARKEIQRWLAAGEEDYKNHELTDEEYHESLGMFKYFSMMIDLLPGPSDEPGVAPETFVLVPPDYDLQNLLADDNGNITAILDWDRVETVPRYYGWARTPDFLQADWEAQYYWPHVNGLTESPLAMDRYRADFARYMGEACGIDGRDGGKDSCFTARSHLYYQLYKVVGESEGMLCFLDKVLREVCPRVDMTEHLTLLGRDGFNEEDESVVRDRLQKLFVG
ncbi:hypothetical protein K490DRAFT_62286 [Saccharata proteae CBS 121410]|uniref:Aminoglycoside phosphotransferase domain-containing protein n=1 Tax=Saccharata proteae CBS 121410 TaxID=1314787 RepID=A0A9P4LZD4_9PEZI|nr:hypothetical protein K490DRAFT_62286 [Saccharata proteae CBS 121410]